MHGTTMLEYFHKVNLISTVGNTVRKFTVNLYQTYKLSSVLIKIARNVKFTTLFKSVFYEKVKFYYYFIFKKNVNMSNFCKAFNTPVWNAWSVKGYFP